VIFGDPRMEPGQKQNVIRAFAAAIRGLTDYIPGPDMGTDEGSGQYPERNILATRELAGIMSRAGLSENVVYRYREIDKAKHNEQFWAERFDQVLIFLFGK